MNTMEPIAKSQERRAAHFWGVFILGLMGINLVMAGIAIYFAIGDPSFRPIPSYGEKAVDFETHRKLLADSVALGWNTSIERTLDPLGVLVRVRDRSGNPVVGAHGTLQAYHFTRAGEVRTVSFDESNAEPGTYFAMLDVSKDGRWQILMTLLRSEDESYCVDREMEWYQ